MVEEIQGGLYGEDKKFAIIVSRFNDFITSRLQSGALDALVRHGGHLGTRSISSVPGNVALGRMLPQVSPSISRISSRIQ